MKNVEIQISGDYRDKFVSGVFTRLGKDWAVSILVGSKEHKFVVSDKPCMATLMNLIDTRITKIKRPRKRYGV